MSQMTQQRSLAGASRATRINPRILLLALGMFALGTDAFVVAGVLPVIAHETGVTVSVAGQLVTAFSLTYGLGAPLLAVLIGRWSPHRVLIVSLGLFCLANVGSALAPTFPLLMLTRILTGCFAAIYAPQAYTMGIALAPPEKRGQALALVVIGLTVATALGSPLGTWVGEHFGWRLSFGLVAGLAGIGFLAFLLSGLPRIATPPAVSLRQRLAPITQPRLVLSLLPAFLWNLAIYTIYTYIGPLLQQNMHIVDLSGMLVVFGLGVVVGNWSGGMIADRVGSQRPLLVSMVLLLIMEIVVPLVTTTWLGGLLALFVWGISGSLLFIPQQHRLLSVAPEHANVILALNNSMFYLGIAGGAVIGGLSLRAVAVTQLGWIGMACVLLALLLFFGSMRLNRDKLWGHKKPTEELVVVPE
ncbi:MFS transporter [Ktedonobacter racemifer]|uniref:Major facilitator superfamily MFS_1 n=1 Tax=Ktedonobacter racemifer DSM 44963 TaxID=485913 RepID=D6TSA0_KTERA|nr:MFS transporter [Ktedonobacter racemifer]EFH83301.1 major facilitator superfamily MFS_1 [Ktedonobacter racemifer DSM 44963]